MKNRTWETALLLVAGVLFLSSPVKADGSWVAPALDLACSPQTTVPGHSYMNIDQTCNHPGEIFITGGFTCSSPHTNSGLLPIELSVNGFFFRGSTPVGWQSIGFNPQDVDGTCQVCVTCLNIEA
jgi:hypothetical protein